MASPTGLKSTSSPLQISSTVTESANNTFTRVEIPLTLNVLDNEVFVITQLNIDVEAPDLLTAIGTVKCSSAASLSTTLRTSVGSIADSNVIGAANRINITESDAVKAVAVAYDREDPLFAAISEDYLGIVATNNMFLQIQGGANITTKTARVRVYGYRASASAAVYAALVQSELLSA